MGERVEFNSCTQAPRAHEPLFIDLLLLSQKRCAHKRDSEAQKQFSIIQSSKKMPHAVAGKQQLDFTKCLMITI
jgi:hypothetical protein